MELKPYRIVFEDGNEVDCWSENESEAREQAENAFPDETIKQVECLLEKH